MTVRMKKGKKFADIYNSQECIERAERDGWTLVQEQQATTEVAESAATTEEKTETATKTTSRSRKKTS